MTASTVHVTNQTPPPEVDNPRLRRRYRHAAEFPFAMLTRKIKTKRVYRCVLAGGDKPCPDGWEVVLGRCGGGGDGVDDSGGGGGGVGLCTS
jgi:hypothetical protein